MEVDEAVADTEPPLLKVTVRVVVDWVLDAVKTAVNDARFDPEVVSAEIVAGLIVSLAITY